MCCVHDCVHSFAKIEVPRTVWKDDIGMHTASLHKLDAPHDNTLKLSHRYGVYKEKQLLAVGHTDKYTYSIQISGQVPQHNNRRSKRSSMPIIQAAKKPPLSGATLLRKTWSNKYKSEAIVARKLPIDIP